MIAASSGGLGILPILIFGFLILWLVVVRPRQRRQNQAQQRLNELRVGDEVLTAGGIYGTVSRIDEDRVTVEIAPKLEVQVARRAIAGILTEREPEAEAPEAAEEPQDDDSGERWRSAFDEDDATGSTQAGGTSGEEKRG